MTETIDVRPEPSPEFDDFASFYRSSAYGRFPQEHRSDRKARFKAFVVDQEAHDFADAACDEWVLGIPLKAACETRFDFGDGWRRARRGRSDCLLVPPGTGVRYEITGPTRLLVVTWRKGMFKDLDADVFRDEEQAFRALYARYFKNVAVETACRSIWQELARKDAASELLLESAMSQLAGALLRCAAANDELRRPRRHDLRRAVAFIEDGFARDLSLADMAQAAGLSPYYFARLFQTEFGLSPYQYLLDRRLGAAERLEATGRCTPQDIPALCGFRSRRHYLDARRTRERRKRD